MFVEVTREAQSTQFLARRIHPPRVVEQLLQLWPEVGSSFWLARNETVYPSGSVGQDIYLIENGQVKVQVSAANGKRCLLSVYVGGDILGEVATPAALRRESAIALGPTLVRRLAVTQFRQLLTVAGLTDAYHSYLSWRLADQQDVIAGMVTMNSELRLAVRLLHLAERLGQPCGDTVRVDLRITQEDLAEMVGTTRTRVGQFLKGFRESGLATLMPRSHLRVHPEALKCWIRQRSR